MSTSTSPVTACVTGASGFLGSSVAVRFLELGHKVRLPFRYQAQCDAWHAEYDDKYPGKLETILLKKPMTEEGAFDEAVQGCDVVVHTASPLPGHFKREEALAMPAEYAQVIYMAAKTFAEKAAWHVAPAAVIGKSRTPGVKSLKDTTVSFRQAWEGLFDQKDFPMFCPELFVSVDDVAYVHVEAALNASVSNGHRYLCSIQERYSWPQFSRALITYRPVLKSRLPQLPEQPTEAEKPNAQYRVESDLAEKHFGFVYEPFHVFAKAYADQVYELAKAEGIF
ncbi:hypothetical protein JCM11251_000978 [Rhodosporidiobolus azoricus]